MKKKFRDIIFISKKWFYENLSKDFPKKNFIFITKKSQLNLNLIKKIKPNFLFFVHWSSFVKKNRTDNYNCVCRHLAPLPKGRGGSPIQNLILKNKKESPICALKMSSKIDSGPIYLKKKIKLDGSLNKIFKRMTKEIELMIIKIQNNKIKPKKQVGKATYFSRISKSESQINTKESVTKIYNRIRMLDNDEYPRAFILKDGYKIIFTNPIKVNDDIKSEVIIKKISN